MSRCTLLQSRESFRVVRLLFLAVFLWPASQSQAQNLFRAPAVGGVSIDAAGVVSNADIVSRRRLAEFMRADFRKAPEGIQQAAPLRMVSLRGLEDAIRSSRDANQKDLPEEVQYLAGLQRIQYVFLYPEQNDIVLAGPGEGWRIDDQGNVVGIKTGRPVLQLDDLLVAFRTAADANRGQGISCSIDPTPEGRQRLDAYLKRLKRFDQSVPRGVEQAMGPQKITLTGVPPESHFARVMVAADFRMKQYAMHLEKAPVDGMPSFIELMKAKRGKPANMMPRWWLACNYDSVARSQDSLAWQIRGTGVKVMTEDDFIALDGAVSGSGTSNPIATQWADTMTQKYDALAVADPVFGELRNLMDLSVVGALIEKYGLADKAELEIPLIMDQNSELAIDSWHAPKMVATQCSFLKVGREYIITASGGVQVESWQVAAKTETDAEVAATYGRVERPRDGRWWWN